MPGTKYLVNIYILGLICADKSLLLICLFAQIKRNLLFQNLIYSLYFTFKMIGFWGFGVWNFLPVVSPMGVDMYIDILGSLCDI